MVNCTFIWIISILSNQSIPTFIIIYRLSCFCHIFSPKETPLLIMINSTFYSFCGHFPSSRFVLLWSFFCRIYVALTIVLLHLWIPNILSLFSMLYGCRRPFLVGGGRSCTTIWENIIIVFIQKFFIIEIFACDLPVVAQNQNCVFKKIACKVVNCLQEDNKYVGQLYS